MHKRLSLSLTVKDGVFTKTRNFTAEHLYSESHISWDSFDEINIINLDGSSTHAYCAFVDNIRKRINVPLALSGGIKTAEDADRLFSIGADRVIINGSLWEEPEQCLRLPRLWENCLRQ